MRKVWNKAVFDHHATETMVLIPGVSGNSKFWACIFFFTISLYPFSDIFITCVCLFVDFFSLHKYTDVICYALRVYFKKLDH